MANVNRKITIQAPAERIWAILEDPKLQSELNPDLRLLTNTPSTVGGFDNTWEYNMYGMMFHGSTSIKVFDQPQHMVYETTGGIPSTWDWQLSEQADGTVVVVRLNYGLPGLFGTIFLRPVVELQNQNTVERELRNLKRMSEVK
ncbi:MAG TPA: SRPBCC family protein [Chloroflexia bacterium]|nr:SRPBCC family protein [Chloroflexia bacterium]